ncbi:MAG: STAS domain-containing protein [Actinomycetota bacterium]|nr:STAS domain-containing protein [Actinomycetota bacterium]
MNTDFAFQASDGLIRMSGDLDLSTRRQAFEACYNCTGLDVELDLSELTFMDSRGYASIIDAADVLQSEGRTLTISGIQGEPLRLLTLIGAPVNATLLHRQPIEV